MGMRQNMKQNFDGSQVLITGGMGFIGSNLAHRLVGLGARVTILDAILPQNGGNPANLDGISNNTEIVIDDIRNTDTVRRLVAHKDYIFNLAGQVGVSAGLKNSIMDFDISCLGQLNLLESCRALNRDARIVFASSRLVYQRNLPIPVDENAPLEPISIYGVHKMTVEQYHRLFNQMYGMPTVCLRITNPYGPRQRIQGGKYGIVNWFVALAMKNDTIKVFGDGAQLRDYLYIDDLTEIFLRCALLPEMQGQVYNAGSGEGISLVEMARAVVETTGAGNIEHVPWPENQARTETGGFVAKIDKLVAATDFRPQTNLRHGLQKTVDFIKQETGGTKTA